MMSSTKTLPLLLVAAGLLLLVSACTGPTGGQDPDPTGEEPADRLPEPAVNLADYEDFNAAPYREEAPVREVDISHDVPEALMEGYAGEGVERTVQGFRIQIFSTGDKASADDKVEEAIDWWAAAQEEDDEEAPALFPEDLPVYIVYRQPYYRVRLGNFASREEASEALALVQEHFPEAFIARDEVTITN